jgi:hypothetical protein
MLEFTGQADERLTERVRRLARVVLGGGVTTGRGLGDRNFVTLPLPGGPDLTTLVGSGPRSRRTQRLHG